MKEQTKKPEEAKSNSGKVAGMAGAAAVVGATAVAFGMMGDGDAEELVEIENVDATDDAASATAAAEEQVQAAQAQAEEATAEAAPEAADAQEEVAAASSHTTTHASSEQASAPGASDSAEAPHVFEEEIPVVETNESEAEANDFADAADTTTEDLAAADVNTDAEVDMAATEPINLDSDEPVDLAADEPLDMASVEVEDVEADAPLDMEVPLDAQEDMASIDMNDVSIDTVNLEDATIGSADLDINMDDIESVQLETPNFDRDAAAGDMAMADTGSFADAIIDGVQDFVKGIVNPEPLDNPTFVEQVDQPELDSSGLIQFDNTFQITGADGNVINAAEFHYSDDGFPSIMADTTGDGTYDSIVDMAGNVLGAAPANMEVADALMQLNGDADYMNFDAGGLDAASDLSYMDNITDTGSDLGVDLVDSGIDMG